MEVIQNNVVQNLMAMFPMRPPELILQCVTHPRNCYEPVDEGVLLNRCIDDLLSREDVLDDDTKLNMVKEEPFLNERTDDYVVDDVPEGDPVVVDDPEVVFTTIPNLQDLDVEELDTPKKKEIFIDLTDDSPMQEKKAGVINSTEISSTLTIDSSKKRSSLHSLSKMTVKSDIDETDGDLPDVLGISVSPCTLHHSKVKSKKEAMPAVTATSLGNPVSPKTLGEAARKYNPAFGNQVANAVPCKYVNLNLNSTKIHDSPSFQVNSQELGTHHRTASTSSTGVSPTSGAAAGATFNAHSRPVVIDGQSKFGSQSKNNYGPFINTSVNVRKCTGQELGTYHQTAATCSTGVLTTSTMSAGGTFNAHSRPVVINGHVDLKPTREHQLQKIRIHVGQNGNYVVGSSTPKTLTVRQELERKRTIPATLSRAPSDEMKSGALVAPPAGTSGTSQIIDLVTPSKTNEKVILPNVMLNNTAAKNGSNLASSTIRIGGSGIPFKITTPSGTKLHSKAATLSRAPSDSSLNTAMSFQPASTLQLSSYTNSESSPNLQINGTSSGQAVTTKQGRQVKPVILKSTSVQGNAMPQGIQLGTVKVNLPKSSLATNVRPTISGNAAPNPAGNVRLVSTSSSNAIQGMTNQSNGQYVGGSSRITTPILPKYSGNGNVKQGSAFSVVKQRPVVSFPQTSNTFQLQTPKPVDGLGFNQLATGSVNNRPGSNNITSVSRDYDKLLHVDECMLRSQEKQIEMLRKELAKYKGPAPPPQPLLPLEPLPLHPPLPPVTLPIPVQGPAGGFPNIPVPRLDPAPKQATPEATGAASNDAGGMQAASVELENMVQQVMKMFPTAEKGVVRGMLLEHRNVNATCNYLLENLDAANGGVPAANPVPAVIKEVEKEIDYIKIDFNKRSFIQNYPQYFNQGLDLLSNDFIKISKTSLRLVMQSLSRGSYAKTKNILEDAIQADPNIQVMMHDDTKGSFFHVQRDGRKFEIRLMKKARKPIHMFQTMHPELQKEVDFYKKHIINETEKSDFEVALRLNEDQYEQEGQLIECGCCCMEVTFENMIQCLEGHLFCQTCLQRYTKEAVYGQGKATLSCLEDGCDSVFPRSQLEKTLTKEILVKYDERVVEESINMADMDNLLRCPNCNYAAVLDKDHKVFSCPECHKETCRNCKEPWKDHYGLECDQVKKQSSMRLTYQERMTDAKVRTCYKCGTKFTKSEGCNKMTCRCGAKMCYICRQPIKDYSHFDNKAAPPRGQIWQPQQGEKCRLWTNSDEDDERAVKEIERQMKAEEKTLRDKTAADLKRPSVTGNDEGASSDAKRPRTG